jgi:hypothetical protein
MKGVAVRLVFKGQQDLAEEKSEMEVERQRRENVLPASIYQNMS